MVAATGFVYTRGAKHLRLFSETAIKPHMVGAVLSERQPIECAVRFDVAAIDEEPGKMPAVRRCNRQAAKVRERVQKRGKMTVRGGRCEPLSTFF